MEVKVEAKLEPISWSTVCHMCLSTDRRTLRMLDSGDTALAYSALAGLPAGDARVCWECRAALARLVRLRRQAERARALLEAARGQLGGANTITGKCLSQLSIHRIRSFNAKFTSGDDFVPTLSDVEAECKDEIDTDCNDFVSDCEVWAEPAPHADPVRPEVSREVKPPCDTAKTSRKRVEKKPRRRSEQPVSVRKAKVKKEDDAVEMFVATEEELASYRQNAFTQMKTSKYMCLTCLEGYKYEENLRKHNEQFHSEAAGAFPCNICASRFPTPEALGRHWSWHFSLYRCRHPACTFVHPRGRTVRAHHALHALREKSQARRLGDDAFRLGGRFECDHCGKAFRQRRQLAVHIKHHSKRVMCEVCGHKCSTLSQLKKHMLAHLDPSYRPFECEQCHKRFIDRHKLLLHTRIHTGERPFKCDRCSGEFVSKEVLARHARDRHSDGGAVERKKFSQARTKSYFINRRYIPGEEERPLRVRRDYKINKDGQNKFECTVCSKKLSTLAALRTHFYVHSDKKPLKCDECDKTFKFHSQLQTHVRFLHKGEKPHQCNICGARFALKATLNVHLSSHSNEKPFKCDQCNVTFKYKAGLWSHKLIHTGQKPHQCTICGSRFTLRGNLVGHMKTHTNDRPFECNVCGRKFPWKRNLKNHFKTHAKEQQLLQMQ